MIKSAMAPATMKVMTMSRRGLLKAGLLSDLGVGEDAIDDWMQNARGRDVFWCGEAVFLEGFASRGGRVLLFDGVIVADRW